MLDGLRGLAIALVMALHFVGQTAPFVPTSWIGSIGRVGWIGVDLFFVLSGFLITGILLEQRGRPNYFRAFYWRRLLRILPPFSAVMAVLWVAALALPTASPTASALFRHYQPWYWTLTTNWLALSIGGISHLPYETGWTWTLSIEEQFYLVWPALVAFVAVRRLAGVLWAIAIAAIVARVAVLAAGDPTNAAYTFTPCRLDALAAGGLLALARRRGDRFDAVARLACAPGLVWVAFAALVYGFLLVLDPNGFPGSVAMRSIGLSVIAGVAALLVACALRADDASAFARFFRSRLLQSLGQYSYALYLWHETVAGVARVAIGEPVAVFGTTLPWEILFVAIAGGGSYLLAALSWRFIESRALALKDRVPYQHRHGTPPVFADAEP